MLEIIISTFRYYLPAFASNFCIMMFWFATGRKVFFKVSKKWFGSNKGYDGLFIGAIVGGIAGLLVSTFWLGFALGIGTWFGNCANSFFKRRIGIKSGGKLPVFDQLDFIMGATFFGAAIMPPTIPEFIIIIIATPFLHISANIILFKIGIKKVPY